MGIFMLSVTTSDVCVCWNLVLCVFVVHFSYIFIWHQCFLSFRVNPQQIVIDPEHSHVEHSGDFSVKHHHGLNIYTFTKKSQEEAPDNMENDIKELSGYIESHSPCPVSQCVQ